MVVKMTFEYPATGHTQEIEPYSCQDCGTRGICRHFEKLAELLPTLPHKDEFHGQVVVDWLVGFASFCPHYESRLDKETEENTDEDADQAKRDYDALCGAGCSACSSP